MRDDLLLYYERELDYLRKMSAQFAEKNPKVAVAPRARAHQVRGSARRAAAGSLRVSGGARSSQD